MPDFLHDSWKPCKSIFHISRIPLAGRNTQTPLVTTPSAEQRYKIEVGHRLRAARLASPVASQVAAADRLTELSGEPVPSSRISNYEHGSRLPDPLTVMRLAKIYGTTPSVIYGFDEAPRSKAEAKLVKRYRETDDRGKSVIDQVAETQPAYRSNTDGEGGDRSAA